MAIDVTRLTSYTPSFTEAIIALGADYTIDIWTDGEITADRLAGYCVLIIVFPQEAYSPSEVTAILDFIQNGHGLLFLGEYGSIWNYYGGIYPSGADPILGPLGISINEDILYDPTHYYHQSTWPLIHIFETHPVTDGIGTYMPAATATLAVNSPAITIATGDDDTYTIPESETGYQSVLAASRFCLGRAVVAGDHNWIADGTEVDPGVFDGITNDNNKDLFVNTIQWLCEGKNELIVDFDPDTLNLKSKGKFVTAYLELPGCDMTEIDVSEILLNDVVPAKSHPTEIGDYDDDGIPDLMVKFDRSEVQEILEIGDEVEIKVTCEVFGNPIEGTDTIRVIKPP